jgi:serine/threonine protein kinase
MSSPLATETVLQGRYRLLRLLAEGGFARTYLAEDQGRFGERCVVKEFCPSANDASVFEKAKELFQREAQTLYQLEHPQVPQFRAMFAEGLDHNTQRLFLVQDFVEGETYRTALRRRLQTQEHFSVQEVRQLLKQLLPVLSYIHSKGIIHRDITLENLMLRATDQTPVLIDFGVVKSVVTQLQQTNMMATGTVVGKFGFAPIEQLQSGRAYPSSDLYSLAVCCLVLLTGLEPSQLFDDVAAVWHWKHHTSVSDGLASVLDKMLAHKPSDRYVTADEVFQALQSIPFNGAIKPSPSPQAIPADSQRQAPDPAGQRPPASAPSVEHLSKPPEHSQIKTIAVSSPVQVQPTRPQGKKPVIPPVYRSAQNGSQRKMTTVAIIILGLLLSLASAFAGWLLMNFLMLRPWDKSPPKVSPTPVQTRSPQFSTAPTIRYSKALDLAPGASVTVQGTIPPGEAQVYRFEGRGEDELSANLTGQNVTLTVLKSDLSPVGSGQGRRNWQGKLPQSDTYAIQVQNRSPQSQSFQLALALSNPAVLPSPTVTPSASISPSPTPRLIAPTIETMPLTFAPEGPTQRLTGQLPPARIQRYTVTAMAGQVLSAAVADNSAVTLTIRDGTGQALNSAQNVLNWQTLVTEAGTYQIDVVPIETTQPARFGVEIGLKQP